MPEGIAEGIGASVHRKEDKKFTTGKGRYTDDINRPCLLYTSPSPRDRTRSRMPSSA